MSLDWPAGALHEPLSGRTLDGAVCRQRVAARAKRFRQLGLGAHDRVVIHYGNTPDFLVDVLAAWMLRACVVPVDPRLTGFEVAALVRRAAPKLSLRDRTPDAGLAQAFAESGTILVFPDELPDDADVALRPDCRPGDPAVVLFTSGTTGQPKGVVHTHASLQARWRAQQHWTPQGSGHRLLLALPVNYSWGLVGSSLYAWMQGGDVCLVPAFRADILSQLGAICDEQRITYLPAVTSIWRVVVRTAAPPRAARMKQVASASGPLTASLARDVLQWSGASSLVNYFALTECGVVSAHDSRLGEPQDGLVGPPLDGVDVRILPTDASGPEDSAAVAGSGDEPGMIWVRSPMMMHGYFEDPEQTHRALRGGWFRTGDIGRLDGRGALHLHGRDREMINLGGLKVYPGDVDAVVQGCAAVKDACTFGFDDPVHGEQVAVAIVLAQGPAALATVFSWASAQLAAFQLPRRWYLVEDIPRTARGKLDRDRVAASCRTLAPVDPRRLEASSARSAGPGTAGSSNI